MFTVSSAACGFSGHIGVLIGARVVQGIGAALMTPQTMAMITRVFPAASRGGAMGLWGATAGVATIAGPLLGGVFVESLGWEWIFFVNVPIGAVVLWFAFTRLPSLPTHTASFDWLGVVLSVVGLGALVFGIQEGESYHWGTIVGPISVWSLIVLGAVVLGAFVWWQHRLGEKALLPLSLFHYRNFSLANVSGMAISFAMIGIFFPLTIFLQSILGLSPIQAALINLPSSLVSGVVAPLAGRLSDRVPGKWVVSFGFVALAGSVAWLSAVVAPGATQATFIAPMILFGLGTGCVFSPLANLATSGLDGRTAGAGAGAFNTTRQVGGVIGSAAIVAILTSRLSIALPAAARDAATNLPEGVRDQFIKGFGSADLSSGALSGDATAFPLPPGTPADVAAQLREAATTAFHSGFSTAVGQTLIAAVAVVVIGLVAALFMRPTAPAGARTSAPLPANSQEAH